MRRLVRKLRSRSTACISSSVCKLPFIKASTSPWAAIMAARSAAAWLKGSSISSKPLMSNPCSAATASILALGPINTGITN